MFWKDGLSRKFAPEHELFCDIWKDGIYFFQKYNIFSLGGKSKNMIFIKKRVEIWYFLYICLDVTSMTPSLPPAKKQRSPCPKKVHLRVTSPASPKKMTFILENIAFQLKHQVDWHLRKCPRSSHQRCSTSKGVLRNFTKFTGKDLYQSLFLNKSTGLRPATLLKRKLWRRCFPVNFAQFLRTLFLQNTLERLLLEFQLFSVLLWKPL